MKASQRVVDSRCAQEVLEVLDDPSIGTWIDVGGVTRQGVDDGGNSGR